MSRFLPFAIVLALCVVGCGSGSAGVSVSQDQEKAFRDPPKEIPPDSLKAMQKSREEGMRIAAEKMKQAQQGNK